MKTHENKTENTVTSEVTATKSNPNITAKTFNDFNLSPDVVDSIKRKGFTIPSEIQLKVIPLVLENKHDIIGVSHTGSGKTASFGLPIVDKIDKGNKFPKAIILAPTRELALQVTSELISYSGKKRLNITTVYGGTSISTQISDLKKGVDIVVGTPGRILDLIERKVLKLNEIQYFVLDEADEMLRMGFVEDIELIFEQTPKEKRVLLFSATMPDRIKQLSKKYMKNQLIVEVDKKIEANKADIHQSYFVLRISEKFDMLCKIIDSNDFFYGIVFCMTKMDVDDLTQKLRKAGYNADCIHGDINQSRREKILGKFRDLKINILVATDVAARGIDVNDLTHVINYSLPKETENYIHRIGRTGRAGKKGEAISFVTTKQEFMIREIEKLTKSKLEKGKLPNAEQIAEKKEINKKKEFKTIVEADKAGTYINEAIELIGEYGAEKVVAALMAKIKSRSENKEYSSSGSGSNSRGNFEKNYEKSDGESKLGRQETVRLFIAKGKENNFDKRELFNYLEKESGIRIDGESVKINGKFSFITVPKKQAEIILTHFKNKGGSRSLIEIASEKQEYREK